MANQQNDRRFRRPSTVVRRQFLKQTGLGLAAAGLVGTGTAAGQPPGEGSDGQPYETKTDVESLPNEIAEVDPGADLTEPVVPTGLFETGEGSAESEEVPLGKPEGRGSGTGAQAEPQTTTPGDAVTIDKDFDGFSAKDVVRENDFNDDGESTKFYSLPSDAQLATGKEYHVTAINTEIGFIERGDPADGERRSDPNAEDYITHYRLEDFFESVLSLATGDEDSDGDGNPDSNQFENDQVFDPWARYDPNSGRFIVSAVEFNLEDTVDGALVDDDDDFEGSLLLAVSRDENPHNPWKIFRLQPSVAEDVPGLVDFEKLGYDGGAVYLTQNFFEQGSGFTGVTVTVLDKEKLFDGEIEGTEFSGLTNPDGSLAFTVQPPAMPGSTGDYYLLNSRFGTGDTITVWTLSDPLNEPTLSNASVSVPTYHNAPVANQPDSEKKIGIVGTLLDSVAWDGSSLYTAHAVAEAQIRWYELEPNGPSVVQFGAFQHGNNPTFFPTIEADRNGSSVGIVYNVSAEDNNEGEPVYLGIEVTGRTDAFDEGQLEDATVVKHGESAYNYDTTKGDRGPGPETVFLRWGDYNGIAVDPNATDTYWVISQYAKGDDPAELDLYGTRIAKVRIE